MFKATLTVLAIVGLATMGFGQVQLERQVIGSAGTSASAGNIQMSYTVGEAVTETGVSSTIILTQGFQQPDPKPVGIEVPDYNLSIKAYPNPTKATVRLEISKEADAEFDVMVFNELGQLMDGKVQHVPEGKQHVLIFDFSQDAAGQYYLELRTGDQSVKTIPVVVIR